MEPEGTLDLALTVRGCLYHFDTEPQNMNMQLLFRSSDFDRVIKGNITMKVNPENTGAIFGPSN